MAMIYDECQKPEYQARVSWSQGDVTMWDNRASWHKAINDYDGHRRYMKRITVEGCALSGVDVDEPADSMSETPNTTNRAMTP